MNNEDTVSRSRVSLLCLDLFVCPSSYLPIIALKPDNYNYTVRRCLIGIAEYYFRDVA